MVESVGENPCVKILAGSEQGRRSVVGGPPILDVGTPSVQYIEFNT